MVPRKDWLPLGQGFHLARGQPTHLELLCGEQLDSEVNSLSVAKETLENPMNNKRIIKREMRLSIMA